MADLPCCGNCRWLVERYGVCTEPRIVRVSSSADAGQNRFNFLAPPRVAEDMVCDFHAEKVGVVPNNYRNAVTGEMAV